MIVMLHPFQKRWDTKLYDPTSLGHSFPHSNQIIIIPTYYTACPAHILSKRCPDTILFVNLALVTTELLP